MFKDGTISIEEIKTFFTHDFDALHDALADATDGSSPSFCILEIGDITLQMHSQTGSTICLLDGVDYSITDIIDMIYALY